MQWPKSLILSMRVPMVLWSHSKLPTVPLPRILFLDSFFGSMPMISMEMETQIPSETEAQFLLGSTNQPRESLLIRQTSAAVSPSTNPLLSIEARRAIRRNR